MAEDSKELTSFSCPFSKFHFNRMPFRLQNAPATFQSVVEEILRPVGSVAANYIDNVIICSRNWKTHLEDLKHVIRCLGEAGFTLKPSECEYGRKHMVYLGHVV